MCYKGPDNEEEEGSGDEEMSDNATMEEDYDNALDQSQGHTYKVSHDNFHSVRTYMISHKTRAFTIHPRRGQCVLQASTTPWTSSYSALDQAVDIWQSFTNLSVQHLQN